MNATDILRREHRVILQAVGALDAVAEKLADGRVLDPRVIAPLVDFFRDFADGWHHAKEEGVLFPMLKRIALPRGDVVLPQMLAEHAEGRNLLRGMAECLDGWSGAAARDRFIEIAGFYSGSITHHIGKEDNGLFRLADKMLDGDEVAEALAKLERDRPPFEERYQRILTRLAEVVPPGLAQSVW